MKFRDLPPEVVEHHVLKYLTLDDLALYARVDKEALRQVGELHKSSPQDTVQDLANALRGNPDTTPARTMLLVHEEVADTILRGAITTELDRKSVV